MSWTTVRPGIQKCRDRYRLHVAIAKKEVKAPSSESLEPIIDLREQVNAFKAEGKRLGLKDLELWGFVQGKVDRRNEPEPVADTPSMVHEDPLIWTRHMRDRDDRDLVSVAELEEIIAMYRAPQTPPEAPAALPAPPPVEIHTSSTSPPPATMEEAEVYPASPLPPPSPMGLFFTPTPGCPVPGTGRSTAASTPQAETNERLASLFEEIAKAYRAGP